MEEITVLRNNKRLIIGIILALIVPTAAAALLIFEFATKHNISSKSIISAIFLLVGDLVFCLRYFGNTYSSAGSIRKNVEIGYKDMLDGAFDTKEKAKYRKQLIGAMVDVNIKKYVNAIKKLEKLLPVCENNKEKYATLLFLALSHSNLNHQEEAIEIYNRILTFENTQSRVYSNLGMLYVDTGRLEEAMNAYKRAVECDPANPYAYNNIASLFIDQAEFEKAVPFAEKALELKSNLVAASNALAVCAAAMGDREMCNKYFRISVTHGVNPNVLKQTIALYTSGVDL